MFLLISFVFTQDVENVIGNKIQRAEFGNNRNEKKSSRSSTPHERSTPNPGRTALNPAALQQLQIQQQQLISQLQLVQQKILMVITELFIYLYQYVFVVFLQLVLKFF